MLSNRTMPPSVVVPVLIYEDLDEAIDWLCDAFGFVLWWRADRHRALLGVGGDGAVVASARRIAQESETSDPTIFRPPRRGEVSHSILVRVEDLESHHARARQGGARILARPRDLQFGERQYVAEDLEGHRWIFSQSIADVAPEDWGATSGS